MCSPRKKGFHPIVEIFLQSEYPRSVAILRSPIIVLQYMAVGSGAGWATRCCSGGANCRHPSSPRICAEMESKPVPLKDLLFRFAPQIIRSSCGPAVTMTNRFYFLFTDFFFQKQKLNPILLCVGCKKKKCKNTIFAQKRQLEQIHRERKYTTAKVILQNLCGYFFMKQI